MIDQNILEEMSHIKLNEMAPELFQDILEIEFEGETANQRLENCLRQAGNPYCFRVGNTPVRVSFRPDGETLDQKIKSYFLGLKIR